jgi:hypothetical protein
LVTALSKPVTTVQRVASFENLRKTTCRAVFSFPEQEITRRERISRRSSVIFDRYGIKVSNARIWAAAAFTTVESSYFHGKK